MFGRRVCHRLGRALGPMELRAPPDFELKPLTDEELKYTVPCYCDRCGTELRMHLLFPRVGGKALEHACVAKPPVLFEITVLEVKPMELPTGMLFYMDHNYQEKKNGL